MQVLTRIILPVALVILALDRLTKWYIVDVLDLKTKGELEVWDPFLMLKMAWNEGINFGIPLGGPWVLISLAVVISLALIVWTMRRNSKAMAFGTGFVVGGALGNAWDRATDWGAVADFLNMSCCGFQNPYSFNVADIAIFLGAVWIAVKA